VPHPGSLCCALLPQQTQKGGARNRLCLPAPFSTSKHGSPKVISEQRPQRLVVIRHIPVVQLATAEGGGAGRSINGNSGGPLTAAAAVAATSTGSSSGWRTSRQPGERPFVTKQARKLGIAAMPSTHHGKAVIESEVSGEGVEVGCRCDRHCDCYQQRRLAAAASRHLPRLARTQRHRAVTARLSASPVGFGLRPLTAATFAAWRSPSVAGLGVWSRRRQT